MRDTPRRTFEIRYVGDRFVGARLPVSVLPDLGAFRDLLVAFAKKRWFAAHEKRKRLPKGFDQALSFDLVEISEGSAVPKIAWDFQEAQPALPGFKDEILAIVDDAYCDVIRLFEAVDDIKSPQALSSEHIKALNKFGSSLRPSERIEFVGSMKTEGKVVYLDSIRRKNLITRVRETYHSRVDGTGRVRGVHSDGRLFVETESYGEIVIEVEADRVRNEFDGNIGASIQFCITVELDHDDKFRNVKEVHEVDLSDSDPLAKCLDRLDMMKQLPQGWYDGQGERISHVAQALAKKFLLERASLASFYSVYPNPDGGVLIELEVNGWDLSLEFSPLGKAQLIAVQVDGESDFDSPVFDELNREFYASFDRLTGLDS